MHCGNCLNVDVNLLIGYYSLYYIGDLAWSIKNIVNYFDSKENCLKVVRSSDIGCDIKQST